MIYFVYYECLLAQLLYKQRLEIVDPAQSMLSNELCQAFDQELGEAFKVVYRYCSLV
jgi:hypothetical protein